MSGNRTNNTDSDRYKQEWRAWLLENWPEGVSTDEFAVRIGKGRSAVFAWVAGAFIPPVDVWATIAKACGLPETPWSMVPPESFRRALARRERREANEQAALKDRQQRGAAAKAACEK